MPGYPFLDESQGISEIEWAGVCACVVFLLLFWLDPPQGYIEGNARVAGIVGRDCRLGCVVRGMMMGWGL